SQLMPPLTKTIRRFAAAIGWLDGLLATVLGVVGGNLISASIDAPSMSDLRTLGISFLAGSVVLGVLAVLCLRTYRAILRHDEVWTRDVVVLAFALLPWIVLVAVCAMIKFYFV